MAELYSNYHYIMYHRHQSCKVQVSISAHDYDECFHGNKTAHTHTRYYRFPKSKRHLCCCSVFFVFCFLLGLGSFVPSSTDFSMCVVFFFFFAVLLLPPILYLLHYFRLFFFLPSTFRVCDGDGVSKVHPSVGHIVDVDDDHGPRWRGTRRTSATSKK